MWKNNEKYEAWIIDWLTDERESIYVLTDVWVFTKIQKYIKQVWENNWYHLTNVPITCNHDYVKIYYKINKNIAIFNL